MVDFVHSDQLDIVIATNKMAASLDLQTIKHYVKNTNHIKINNIEVPHLSQSKLYLKIIDISYFYKNTNISLTVDVVKTIIKNNHIFNNITIASRPRVIKVFPKSNIDIIWLDIWDV